MYVFLFLPLRNDTAREGRVTTNGHYKQFHEIGKPMSKQRSRNYVSNLPNVR